MAVISEKMEENRERRVGVFGAWMFCFFWGWGYNKYQGQMANQQICINRKKENFKTKKRITKRANRNQPNKYHVDPNPAPVISDKKARREAKKLEIKQQKKLNKQLKREGKMDVEESD